MEATFLNANRSEYSEPEAASASRVVYVSWYPDDLKLSLAWVRQFKEALDGYDRDDGGIPLRSMIQTEPGDPGESNVRARDAIDMSRLGEITDFVATLTARYFSMEKAMFKRSNVSELTWVLETVEARGRDLVVWIAALEANLDLNRTVGTRTLQDFMRWHALREDLLDPFPLFTPDDLVAKQQFAGEVNLAVRLLRRHGRKCPVCK